MVVRFYAEDLASKVYFTAGGFTAIFYNCYVHHFCRIIVEFLAPGTDPLTRIRFLSARILTTFKLVVFTRSEPIRPGRRFPLITRDAKEALPIEPGARKRLC